MHGKIQHCTSLKSDHPVLRPLIFPMWHQQYHNIAVPSLSTGHHIWQGEDNEVPPWVHFPHLFLTALRLSAGVPYVMGSPLMWTASGNASSLHELLGQSKGRKGLCFAPWCLQRSGVNRALGTAARKNPPPASPEVMVDALYRSVFKSSTAGLSPRQWGGGDGGLRPPSGKGFGFNCWFTACQQKYMAAQ